MGLEYVGCGLWTKAINSTPILHSFTPLAPTSHRSNHMSIYIGYLILEP